jgi:hypothetical protein
MLQMRPGCECCDRDLPPDSAAARICSFECTFCSDCAEQRVAGICPNCGGELLPRLRDGTGNVTSVGTVRGVRQRFANNRDRPEPGVRRCRSTPATFRRI